MTSFMNILFITHASLTASETTVNDGLPESLITSPLYLTTPRKLTKEDYMNIATSKSVVVHSLLDELLKTHVYTI